MDFWNPNQPFEVQQENISNKLKSINLFEEFNHEGNGGGMFKTFDLNTFDKIKDIDDAMCNFVKKILKN